MSKGDMRESDFLKIPKGKEFTVLSPANDFCDIQELAKDMRDDGNRDEELKILQDWIEDASKGDILGLVEDEQVICRNIVKSISKRMIQKEVYEINTLSK